MATAYDNWKQTAPDDRSDDDRVPETVEALRADPAMVREADEWAWGDQSAEHYNGVESALADLHDVEPAKLLGSDLLARLYRLAKVHGDARTERLTHMAQARVAQQDAEAAEIAASRACMAFDQSLAA